MSVLLSETKLIYDNTPGKLFFENKGAYSVNQSCLKFCRGIMPILTRFFTNSGILLRPDADGRIRYRVTARPLAADPYSF